MKRQKKVGPIKEYGSVHIENCTLAGVEVHFPKEAADALRAFGEAMRIEAEAAKERAITMQRWAAVFALGDIKIPTLLNIEQPKE